MKIYITPLGGEGGYLDFLRYCFIYVESRALQKGKGEVPKTANLALRSG